jgi:hypothetical protein
MRVWARVDYSRMRVWARVDYSRMRVWARVDYSRMRVHPRWFLSYIVGYIGWVGEDVSYRMVMG